ncbi:MAG: glutamate--cysteine ligase [Actinomycetota bacterium]|nr:glutamate--cysteine ligase [Actinomycetota bacterium]
MDIEFRSSERSSLGVELELLVVDRETRELCSAASEVLAKMGAGQPDGAHPKAKHELFESTIEVITGVCHGVGEARADLEETLAEVRAQTDQAGLELLCSGSHPFSDWGDQQVSPDPRYHDLVEQMQWAARRLQIFGTHVHVGVRSAEKAIAIANSLAVYIPHFLGLSASSPYWRGYDTGLASARSKVFEALPTAGLPDQFSDWSEFERFMRASIRAKSIRTIREVWWDIRPHPHFGTVELRICDGLPTLTEVASVAAMSQCLVEWMDRRHDEGQELERRPSWVLRQNKWRAARYGMDAEIIVDEEGGVVGLRDSVSELVEQLSPVAERLGCEPELRHVLAVAERPSYARQREVVAAGGTLLDVVDCLIAELRSDEAWNAGAAGPAPAPPRAGRPARS